MSSDPDPPSPNGERQEEQPFDFAAHHDKEVHGSVSEQTAKDVLLLLIGFRFINSLFSLTFFQPDEYFQALEPAWQMAFGSGSGAWITWASSPPFPLEASSF
jgi:GPI mannosyltransferase 3